jgi:hypothetical protein
MANQLYANAKELFLTAGFNLSSDTIKAALVTNGYTLDAVNHDFLDDLGANRVGTDQTLGTKTVTNGVFDAADVTWTAVAAGSTVQAVVLYKDTGVAATSPLIAWIDTITGFPLATNGGDITVQWDAGAYKIFSL